MLNFNNYDLALTYSLVQAGISKHCIVNTSLFTFEKKIKDILAKFKAFVYSSSTTFSKDLKIFLNF